ncbi:uncharacterized protein [Rutidosis leptorrhynchoides]|uniref:uncharacterized protein n=1 Tax=Rutidosis leptorrhynchoides TaxID=125765 RepID=UPI003A99FC3B
MYHKYLGLTEIQLPFKASFIKDIGIGDSTLFWKEHWIGHDKLCNIFSRIYKLESNQHATIRERVSVLGSSQNANDDHIFNWSWVREPSGRTADERDCLIGLIAAHRFNGNKKDSWTWAFSPNGVFTVKKLATIVDEQLLNSFGLLQETIRNHLVPKKIEIFIWRTLNKRLPVRLELDKRGIDLHIVRCSICDDELESAEHSLLSCKNATDIWVRVFKWWNINNFTTSNLSELLIDCGSSSLSRHGKLIWQAVRWCCAYLIWKNRNNMIFKGKN